jgi:hypothetical protein
LNEMQGGKEKGKKIFQPVGGTSSGPEADPVKLPAIGRAPFPRRREPGRETDNEGEEGGEEFNSSGVERNKVVKPLSE